MPKSSKRALPNNWHDAWTPNQRGGIPRPPWGGYGLPPRDNGNHKPLGGFPSGPPIGDIDYEHLIDGSR